MLNAIIEYILIIIGCVSFCLWPIFYWYSGEGKNQGTWPWRMYMMTAGLWMCSLSILTGGPFGAACYQIYRHFHATESEAPSFFVFDLMNAILAVTILGIFAFWVFNKPTHALDSPNVIGETIL